VFGAGTPLQDHDAGVVLELVCLMVEDVAHQAPHGFRYGVARRDGGADEVGEPLPYRRSLR